MAQSRIYYSLKNMAYGWLGSAITLILNFISRTVFIYTLGVTYLGVNGLFANIIGTLSLAELGIGTAINYSLYNPVANGNREKIKSIMRLYKKMYRSIAIIILVFGLLLIPLLDIIVKDPGNIGNIKLYYIIFLYNTVITYFVSYKFSLVNAEQKNYVVNNINTIVNIISVVLQLIILLFFKNFLLYLLTGALVGTLQKIFINMFLNKQYPYLLDKNVKRLERSEFNDIKKNIKSLILHKFGEVGVYQTDNIIISSFINISMVGIISNYTMIINAVNNFVSTAFNMIISSFGNLIATEAKDKQYDIFKVYRFVAFWVYGFVSIAIYTLSDALIIMWLGNTMLVPKIVLFLIMFEYFLKGQRVCINNVKAAGGVFYNDRYIGFAQAIINIIVSVTAVRLFGLPGVYIGTVVQGLFANITRPILVYKEMFNKSSRYYFTDSIKYLAVLGVAWLFSDIISECIYKNEVNLITFAISVISVCVVPNLIFLIVFRKSNEYIYIKNVFINKILRRSK